MKIIWRTSSGNACNDYRRIDLKESGQQKRFLYGVLGPMKGDGNKEKDIMYLLFNRWS